MNSQHQFLTFFTCMRWQQELIAVGEPVVAAIASEALDAGPLAEKIHHSCLFRVRLYSAKRVTAGRSVLEIPINKAFLLV